MPKVLLFISIGTPYRPRATRIFIPSDRHDSPVNSVKWKIKKIKHLATSNIKRFPLLSNTYKETCVLTMTQMFLLVLLCFLGCGFPLLSAPFFPLRYTLLPVHKCHWGWLSSSSLESRFDWEWETIITVDPPPLIQTLLGLNSKTTTKTWYTMYTHVSMIHLCSDVFLKWVLRRFG